jgi:DNA-binding NarL/FixJ family response regulator
MDKLRVFLADDHHVVRAGLKALIDNQVDMEVVGEAGDGRSAVEGTSRLDPDVVVMDVTMPIMGGAEATKRIRAAHPEVKVLALTVHEDRGYLEQLVQAGASGYVLKRAVADDLIHAIRSVATGGAYLDPAIAGMVLGGLAGGTAPEQRVRGAGKLSDREAEVLSLVAKGYTNREIASRLDISTKTVETHKARAMEKLDLASRADIVGYAVRQGWLSES